MLLLFCACIISVTSKNIRGYNYDLPEIIQNNSPDQLGYQYPLPDPPFSDETSPSYGPPGLDLPPPNLTLPPLEDDVITNPYLPPNAQFRISNMTCLDSPTNGYFRATIGLTRNLAIVPVVDDVGEDCITGSGDIYRLDLDGEKLKRCGVRFCSNGVNLCVSVRMPTVRGLKLPEDPVIVLRCRPQERVVMHTKQLRMNAQNIIHQARSTQPLAVVTGGSKRLFDSQVALFRRAGSGNEFTKLVSPGATVQLGEELMLKAVVRDGDGWHYSRLGDVTVHHVSSTGRIRQNAFTLLDSAGCRDIRARAVCPLDPVQSTPLVNTLGLRAFMFQGMASGDEMIMSVRVIGCLHLEDCQNKPHSCRETVHRTRLRRSSPSGKNITNNFQSYLEFRVVTPGASATNATGDAMTSKVLKSNAFVMFVGVICSSVVLFSVAGFCFYITGRKYYY